MRDGLLLPYREKKMTQEATTILSLPQGMRGVNGWQRLRYLEQEEQRLESYLALWTAQKERTEARIAAMKLEKKLLLRTLSSDDSRGTYIKRLKYLRIGTNV